MSAKVPACTQILTIKGTCAEGPTRRSAYMAALTLKNEALIPLKAQLDALEVKLAASKATDTIPKLGKCPAKCTEGCSLFFEESSSSVTYRCDV